MLRRESLVGVQSEHAAEEVERVRGGHGEEGGEGGGWAVVEVDVIGESLQIWPLLLRGRPEGRKDLPQLVDVTRALAWGNEGALTL